MRSRFVTPDTRRLELTDGDYLIVKRQLTHGEELDAFARQTIVGTEGTVRINPLRVGDTKVLAYLLDWSLREYAIKGQPVEVVESALRALAPEDYAEIKAAIDAHEEAMRAAREAEKKTGTGGTRSAPISPSPDAATGGMSGSVPSILMSTTS